MDFTEELKNIARINGGIITTRHAARCGISRAMLSKLFKKGVIKRIATGQYILSKESIDGLLSIGLRSKRIIFSHETALFLHGVSDKMPYSQTITVPTGCTPSPSIQEGCKIYFIKPDLFELGKTVMKTPSGNNVAAYDLERTICDIVRSRNKLRTASLPAVLKAYTANSQKDLNRLYDYAGRMRISSVIQNYFEVLVNNR